MIQSTYLNLTHTFYTAESNVLADSGMKANDFLRHAQTRSQEEHERASDVLVESSVQDVRDTTETALLTGRLQWIAKDGMGWSLFFVNACLRDWTLFRVGSPHGESEGRRTQENVQTFR